MSKNAFTRLRVVTIIAATLVSSGLRPALAQQADLQIQPYAGAYIPTGEQRSLLKSAVFTGVQMSWLVIPQFALTGTFGWSPSKDHVAPREEKIDIYQLDVGGEWRAPTWYASGATHLAPFIGAGVGARRYEYRNLVGVDPKTNVDGYASLGAELGFGIWGVRAEGRDYVSQFKSLTSATTGDKTRNDVTVAAGVTLRF